MITKKRKKVVANGLLEGEELRTIDGQPAPECEVTVAPECTEPIIDYKACAEQHIMEAIKCLSKISSTDAIAKESIANLAVIAFDLK